MLLSRLRKELDQLSRAERRVAEVILADPEASVHSTTAQLARQAEVSDPMVSRLCRSVGCSSFPEFKVQLAQCLASKQASPSALNQAIAASDDTAQYVEKLINANQAALEYLRRELDQDKIEQAIELLDQTQRIEIFGMGGCASIAQDAQHRLFRLGTPTIAYEDNLKQRMTAAAADRQSLILLISFTGKNRDMVETAQIAKRAGAKLIAITDPDSPLADECDVVLTSGSELEDTTMYVPMATRIVILTIIDSLTTGLALTRGDKLGPRLKQMKSGLDSTKINRK